MNTNKILFAALLTSIMTSRSLSWFDFDAIEQHIEENVQAMRQLCKPPTHQTRLPTPHYQNTSLDINTTQQQAIVTFYGIDGDSIEARLNDANTQLTITTPVAKLMITARNNIITIEAQEIINNREEHKKGIIQCSSTSFYKTRSSVPGKLLLENQTTDYNADTKELIVTIPFISANKGKVVPINKLPSQSSLKTLPIPQDK